MDPVTRLILRCVVADLILVHEPEAACRTRLIADGFDRQRALEISSYLAQSTDLALEFGDIEQACRARGIRFRPVELDELAGALPSLDPAKTLVWTLTDGIAYFRGGAAPALARLGGFRSIGADDSLFALCQDKFRAGAVLRALGLPCPDAGLARNGRWIVQPPGSSGGWFVKPNRLGAKIGIWPDSRCDDLGHALDLSRRVHQAYRDDVIVQPYVAGRNARASFLGLTPDAGIEALGVFLVDSGGDFQTMADSLALYGETGAAAKAAGAYQEPELVAVSSSRPVADRTIRDIAARLMDGLGLRDVFSIDFRVEADDSVHLIEFEVCPGLPCFDFRAYCRSQWGLSLAEAMVETAAARLK
jgi:D-alanine-D-alanine ligase-like ATP-grasp enzyme